MARCAWVLFFSYSRYYFQKRFVLSFSKYCFVVENIKCKSIKKKKKNEINGRFYLIKNMSSIMLMILI